MFQNYKDLVSGKLSSVDNNKLFILNRWASFSPNNIDTCLLIDRLMLKCNKDIIKYLMWAGFSKSIPQYIKADAKDQFLIDAYKKHYGFSTREYEMQKHLIDVPIEVLAKEQGWDKKMCKTYKVAWDEPKKIRLEKTPKSVTLGDF